MNNLYVLSAIAGAGKTTAVIDAAIKQAKFNRVVIIQETLDLINQTVRDINNITSDVIVNAITSNEPNVTRRIFDGCKDMTPRIMLITHEGFKMAITAGANFEGFIGYWDEFMEVVSVVELKRDLDTTAFDMSIVEVSKHNKHSVITASDQLKTWMKKGKPSDYGFDGIEQAGIVDMLLADYRVNYLSPDRTYFTSLITPKIFNQFESMTLCGACWNSHEQSMFWGSEGIQVSPLQDSLRQVSINSSVTLGYFTEFQWSQTFINNNRYVIADILNNVFVDHSDYLYGVNSDVTLPDLKMMASGKYVDPAAGAFEIKSKCAGLNKFKDANAAVFLTSMTRPLWFYRQIMEVFNFDLVKLGKLEIECHNAYFAYQFLYRTCIRKYNGEAVDFVVGSKLIAECVQSMMKCSPLLYRAEGNYPLLETTDASNSTCSSRLLFEVRKDSAASLNELLKTKKKEISSLIKRARNRRHVVTHWETKRDSAMEASNLDDLIALLREIHDFFNEKGWSIP